MDKKEITYPRMWGFRVIGEDKEKMREAIKKCINNQECEIEDNNAHGKYFSQKFEVYVTSKEERDEFFNRLKNHKDIKYVL